MPATIYFPSNFFACPDISFVVVSAGVGHTCGLDAYGTAFCWGASGLGQLGNGGSSVPLAVVCPLGVAPPAEGAVAYVDIAAGKGFTLGLSAAGLLFA